MDIFNKKALAVLENDNALLIKKNISLMSDVKILEKKVDELKKMLGLDVKKISIVRSGSSIVSKTRQSMSREAEYYQQSLSEASSSIKRRSGRSGRTKFTGNDIDISVDD